MVERAARAFGVDWFMWRVLLAEKPIASLVEVRDLWTFADLFDAHVVLDAVADAKPDPEE